MSATDEYRTDSLLWWAQRLRKEGSFEGEKGADLLRWAAKKIRALEADVAVLEREVARAKKEIALERGEG